MKTTLLLIGISMLFAITLASAAMPPYWKECIQRGYTVIGGDTCLFPDNTTCPILEFNNGTCGQEWMTEDYCVEENVFVWDYDMCCDGLEPIFPQPGQAGQPYCGPLELECGSSTNMDFCQNCYDNGGEVKPGEAGCWCESLGYYINAWFGDCPSTEEPSEPVVVKSQRSIHIFLRSNLFPYKILNKILR